MKKLGILTVFVSLFLVSVPAFATTPAEACKGLQSRIIENITKMRNCTAGGGYGVTTGYIIKGIENGKCHYQKSQMVAKPSVSFKVLAECYAPMSVMQRFADDNLRAAKEMCISTGLNFEGYAAKEDEKTLEEYCK